MNKLLTLDAHAHLDTEHTSEKLAACGAVIALTLSLDEADRVVERYEPYVIWGVGCHPRRLQAQESFDAQRFAALAERTAIVDEIGLNTGSRVPMELQLQTFRQALAIVSGLPPLVSIHSYRVTGPVLQELRRQPVTAPHRPPSRAAWSG